MPIEKITITGLTEVMDKLVKMSDGFKDLNPLFDLLSGLMIDYFNPNNTPFYTGWFLSNIMVLDRTENTLVVGESLGSVVYAARVIFGFNKSGNPFSELGHEMFDRELNNIAGIVIEETENYYNNIMNW